MKPDYTQLLAAISFAAHKHRDQRRKDAAVSPSWSHVNLAAGLEDSIVRDLNPPWNRLGTM